MPWRVYAVGMYMFVYHCFHTNKPFILVTECAAVVSCMGKCGWGLCMLLAHRAPLSGMSVLHPWQEAICCSLN